jgi:hypothetical protein
VDRVSYHEKIKKKQTGYVNRPVIPTDSGTYEPNYRLPSTLVLDFATLKLILLQLTYFEILQRTVNMRVLSVYPLKPKPMKYVETKLKFSVKNLKDLWRQIEKLLEFSTIIKSPSTFEL